MAALDSCRKNLDADEHAFPAFRSRRLPKNEMIYVSGLPAWHLLQQSQLSTREEVPTWPARTVLVVRQINALYVLPKWPRFDHLPSSLVHSLSMLERLQINRTWIYPASDLSSTLKNKEYTLISNRGNTCLVIHDWSFIFEKKNTHFCGLVLHLYRLITFSSHLPFNWAMFTYMYNLSWVIIFSSLTRTYAQLLGGL